MELDSDALFDEFKQRRAQLLRELSYIDDGCGVSRSPMQTGMSVPSFASATSSAGEGYGRR